MKNLLIIGLTLGLSVTASAQLIVGNDQSGSATIWNVDPTGVNPPQALYTSTGNEAKPWGVAYDHDTNTLYWNNGSVLYSSKFGPTLTPTNLGTMQYNAASVNFVGLAYYVTDGLNTAQPYFYVFDIATGQQVGTLPSPFTGSGTFSAAAFVPEPTGLMLIGLGLMGLRRRWKWNRQRRTDGADTRSGKWDPRRHGQVPLRVFFWPSGGRSASACPIRRPRPKKRGRAGTARPAG